MLNIIYNDENYVVCEKPVGVSSQKSENTEDMLFLLAKKLNAEKEYIHPVHRLDVQVGGVMIYALGSKSAAKLSKLVAENRLKKYYLAAVHGVPPEEKGVFSDLLFKDSKTNKSYVVKKMRKGVKKAELEYEVLSTAEFCGEKISLVKILLHTGRTHQIRVQFAHRKMPLLGDRRYGSGKDKCNVALWSEKIEFLSPFDNKQKNYSLMPEKNVFPWSLFENYINR